MFVKPRFWSDEVLWWLDISRVKWLSFVGVKTVKGIEDGGENWVRYQRNCNARHTDSTFTRKQE